MKLLFYNILIFFFLNNYPQVFNLNLRYKSLEQDPFKLLGIPEFHYDIERSPKAQQIPKLDSLDDLPRFMQGGYINTSTGLKMLIRFLTQDDESLKENGGVYDQTGMDGLSSDEEPFEENTEQRNKQRARSAASLWLNQQISSGKFEAYGCSKDKESIEGWLTYLVLMMDDNGAHKIVKVCIPNNNDAIGFGMAEGELCKDKIGFAEIFRKKSQAYLENAKIPGLEKLWQRMGDKKSSIQSPPEKPRFQQVQSQNTTNQNDQEKDTKLQNLKQKMNEIQKEIDQIQQPSVENSTQTDQSAKQDLQQQDQSQTQQNTTANQNQSPSLKENDLLKEIKELKNEVKQLKQQIFNEKPTTNKEQKITQMRMQESEKNSQETIKNGILDLINEKINSQEDINAKQRKMEQKK